MDTCINSVATRKHQQGRSTRQMFAKQSKSVNRAFSGTRTVSNLEVFSGIEQL